MKLTGYSCLQSDWEDGEEWTYVIFWGFALLLGLSSHQFSHHRSLQWGCQRSLMAGGGAKCFHALTEDMSTSAGLPPMSSLRGCNIQSL